jgi:transcription initiation factor TFIIIB Brf1 subunit/transcription initiation factor TFIIB
MNTCPECGSKKIENNHEGQICKKCGLVIEESIYSGEAMVV